MIEVVSGRVCECGTAFYRRCEHGPEFVLRALLKWIVDHGIETALIDPIKPWQNGATKSECEEISGGGAGLLIR